MENFERQNAYFTKTVISEQINIHNFDLIQICIFHACSRWSCHSLIVILIESIHQRIKDAAKHPTLPRLLGSRHSKVQLPYFVQITTK